MKTIKFSLITVVCLLFVSCSEDDQPSVSNSQLVGKWKLEEYYYSGDSKANYQGMDMESSYEVNTENSNAYLEFLEDNTFKATGTIDYIMSMDYMGVTMDETVEGVAFNNSGNWSINGDILNVSNQMATVNSQYMQQAAVNNLTIEELTDSRMVLSFDIAQEMSQAGLDYNVTMTGKQVYSK